MAHTVVLEGGAPWGIRLSGGKDFGEPVRIAKVNPNSKAYNEGIQAGDYVESINDRLVRNLRHDEALQLIRNANKKLVLELSRASSACTSPVPEIRLNGGGDHLSNHTSVYGNQSLTHNNLYNKHFHSNNSSTSGVSKVKTYKPVSFSVTNSVLGTFSPSTTSSNVFSPSPTSSNAATYKNSTYPSFGVSGISGSHSVPSSPSLSSKTNLRMENRDVPSLDANSNSYKVNSNLEKFSPSSPTPLQISTQSVSHTAAPLLLSPGASERSITPRPFSPKPGVWTPGQDAPSIETDLKEREEKPAPPPPEESFAWKPPERSTTTTSPTVTTETTTTSTTAAMTTPTQWNGTISHFAETKSGLPPTQSATVTLLQKSREGQIPKGAVYVGSEETTEGDKIHTDTFYLLPGETKTETKTTVHEQPMYDGIGPVDNKTGMPVGFRKHVDEKNQHAWYKQMYSSLHRQPKDKKDSNPYRPTYKFPDNFDTQSEPDEPNPYRPSYEFPNGGTNGITNGDMRNHSPLHSPTRSEKMSSWSPPHASYRNQVYKVQPRSIEDYEPGKSSISATEKRITQLIFNPPIEKPGQYSKYTDSGREPEFKKRESTLSPKSDVSSHDLYLQVQKGGDIPTSGLGFPLPKRKDTNPALAHPFLDLEDLASDSRILQALLKSSQNDASLDREELTHQAIKDYLNDPLTGKILDKIYETAGPYAQYISSLANTTDLGTNSLGHSCESGLNCSKCNLNDACAKIAKESLSLASPRHSICGSNPRSSESPGISDNEISQTNKLKLDELSEKVYLEKFPNHVDNYFADIFSDTTEEDLDSASTLGHDPVKCNREDEDCNTSVFLDDILFEGYPYNIFPHLKNSTSLDSPDGDDLNDNSDEQDKSRLKSNQTAQNIKQVIQAVRKPNAKKFSFTKACLDEFFNDSSADKNAEMAGRKLRFQSPPRRCIENGHESDLESDDDVNNMSNGSGNSWSHDQVASSSSQNIKGSKEFQYKDREIPSQSIADKIKQYETDNQGNTLEKTLEEELSRPEVQAMLRKYNPVPGADFMVMDTNDQSLTKIQGSSRDLDSSQELASSKEFDIDEWGREECEKRQEYRQKVTQHYKRLLEEQVLTPDSEYLNRSWSSSVDSATFRESDSPTYKIGIDESDWREIDHARSRSLERDRSSEHTNRLSKSLSSSLERSSSGVYERGRHSVSSHNHVSSESVPNIRTEDNDVEERYVDSDVNQYTSDLSFNDEDIDEDIDFDEQVEYNRPHAAELKSAIRDFHSPIKVTSRPPKPANSSSSKNMHLKLPPDKFERQQFRTRAHSSSPVSDNGRHQSLDEYYKQLGSDSSERSSRLDPATYQSYAAGILHSSHKSEKFLRLHNYYATMERITEIEDQTAEDNVMCGKPEVNIMDINARSLGSLAPQSKADDLLLAKYKMDAFWELKELYADLEEAQENEEFFYDSKNIEHIQWNPWKDVGLNVKELTIQDLQSLYESGKNRNTKQRSKYKKDPRSFRRELSFKKLCKMYQHLDEESQKERILDDWLNDRWRSRRSSDASSSTYMSTASLAGSYIEIMENAAKKAKERPLYGYYINESAPNYYEDHVEQIRNMSKSCPDMSKLLTNKRKTKYKSSKQPPTSKRYDSFGFTSFTRNTPPSSRTLTPESSPKSLTGKSVDCSPQSAGHSSLEASPRSRSATPVSARSTPSKGLSPRDDKIPPWRKNNSVASPTAKSSESGYDSLDNRPQQSVKTKPDLRNLKSKNTLSPVNSSNKSGTSLLVENDKRSTCVASKICTKNERQSRWQPHSEIRGVFGSDKTSQAFKKERSPGKKTEKIDPMYINRKQETKKAIRDLTNELETNSVRPKVTSQKKVQKRDTFTLKENQACNKNLRRGSLDSLEKRNIELMKKFRKDSKPDPGSVTQAIKMFKDLENFEDPPLKCEHGKISKASPRQSLASPSSESLVRPTLVVTKSKSSSLKKDLSPITSVHSPDNSISKKQKRCMKQNENKVISIDSKKAGILSSAKCLQNDNNTVINSIETNPHLSSKRIHTVSPPQRSGSNASTMRLRCKSSEALNRNVNEFIKDPDPLKPCPVSNKELNPEAFKSAKSKFECQSMDDLNYPKSALTSKSLRTALGRYEAKIRSKSQSSLNLSQSESESDPSTPSKSKSFLGGKEEYSKSTPNLWNAFSDNTKIQSTDEPSNSADKHQYMSKSIIGDSKKGKQHNESDRRVKDSSKHFDESNSVSSNSSSKVHYDKDRYDFISVTRCRSENGDEEEEFTFKYNPSTGRLSPLSHVTDDTLEDTISQSSSQLSQATTVISANRSDLIVKPSQDSRFEKVFDINLSPGPGEEGLIKVNYYEMKDKRCKPSAQKGIETARPKYTSNYGEGQFSTKSNEAFAKAVASIEPMVNSLASGGSWDMTQPNLERQIVRDDFSNPMELQKEVKLISPTPPRNAKRPATKYQTNSSNHLNSSSSGDENSSTKYSNLNKRNIQRPQSLDNIDNIQPWEQSSITRTSSITTGTGSADTLVIRGSNADITQTEPPSRSFTKVNQMKSSSNGKKMDKSYSEPNLNRDVESKVQNQGHVKDEVMKSPNFHAIKQQYEGKLTTNEKKLVKALTCQKADSKNELQNLNIKSATESATKDNKSKLHAWKREYIPDQPQQQQTRHLSPKAERATLVRHWDISREEHKEETPRDFIDNISTIEVEWEKDKNKHSSGYQIGLVHPQPRHPAPVLSKDNDHRSKHNHHHHHHHHTHGPPEYKSPPQYCNPITSPQYNRHQQQTQDHSRSNEDWINVQNPLVRTSSPQTQTSRPNSLHLGDQFPQQHAAHRMNQQHSKSVGHLAGHGQSQERSHSASSASRHGQDRVDGGRSHGSTLDRRQRDEEAARRKAELQRYYEEEKRKKMQQEIKDKDARRHHDTFIQKSPIGQDRFDELGGVAASALQRPKKKNPTVVRGKAKALYSFTAQNTKELSFRRHDTIYLLRQIDKNWYEGEHHGRIGMFPKNYVEVITSLDEARSAAWQREGLAKVRYNFNPQTHQEMKLLKGETIQLIRRIDENWMEGRVNDRQGIFPASYVEIITEPDTPLMTPTPSYATTPVPGSPGQLSPGASTISNGPAPTIPSAPISPSLSGLNQFSPGSSKSWDVRSPYSTLDRRGYNGSDSRYGTLDRDYGGGGGFTSGYDTDTTAKSYSNTLDRKSERSYTTGTLERDRGHLNVLGLAPSRPNGLSNGRTSPYPKDDVKNSYTRKYEERISTSKPDEGLYPPYRALYTYAPQNEDELELREGDIVYVMEKCDDGWYVGTSHRTKEFGTFPGNYVQRA